MVALSTQAQIIADWTFETSLPATAGPFSPEVGAGSATGFHAGAAVYSTPAGNGSSHSFSSTLWAVGDYYQFQVSTLGLSGVLVSYDQTSSNTGPGKGRLQYSTDGINFTPVGAADYTIVANASPNPAWNATTASSLYSYTYDLSAITALNNASAVYFRVVDTSTTSANGGTVAVAGTDRIDNFIVQVPEPSALVLAGFGLLMLRWRRN